MYGVSYLLFGVLFTFSFLIHIVYAIRQEKELVLFPTLLSITLHFAISWYNHAVEPTIGADEDAIMFIENAMGIDLKFYFGTEFYLVLMKLYFITFEQSALIGHAMSSFAFSVGLYYFFKITDVLALSNVSRLLSVLVIGFLPTSVLFFSISLRESYQFLFLVLSVLYLLNFLVHKRTGYFLIAVFFSVLMSFFHKGLLPIAFFNILVVLYITYRNSPVFPILAGGMVFLLLIVGGAASTSSSRGVEVIGAIASGDIMNYVEIYRQSGEGLATRATYSISGDFGVFNIVIFPFLYLVYYMFYPFVWKVAGVTDLYASIEGLIRLCGVYLIFFRWRRLVFSDAKTRLLVYCMLISSIIWAAGTTNFGTGIRHHIVHDWLLLLVCLYTYEKKNYKEFN